jgi:hypothetical protein
MFNRKNSAIVFAAAIGLTIVGFLGAGPASAKPGDVVVTGSCSAASDYKLKLGPRDGAIETEFEVDSNVAGQTWKVRITDNGTRVFAGSATTTARSGSFTIRPRLADQAGTDAIVATAVNPATHEKCVAQASV